jgi:hypothetical protein
MNKLDLHPSSLTQPVDTRSEISAFQQDPVSTSFEQQSRLLVLLPADVDHSAVTRQLWKLAISTRARVQLLSLCKDVIEESGLRRKLATMCALIQEGGVPSEAKVEIGTNWVDVIKRNHRKGDLIVCFAEQRAGLLQRPLSQILQSNINMDAQVYILSGLDTQNPSKPNWFSQILTWTGSVGIIVCSFLLQIRIMSLPQDWAQTTLLISSVAGEIWLIWVWNNLFG